MVEPVAPDPGVTVPETSADRSAIRLYTEHYLIRGRLATPGELTSVLNAAGERLELEAAVYDEFGSREIVAQVPWVEVNLGLVLIAALDGEWAPAAEIVAAQARDEVLVGLPPFRVTGRLASRGAGSGDLRAALRKGVQRFIRIEEATFWSEALNEPRTHAPWLAVNSARAHLIAPHQERDVWAGADGFQAAATQGESSGLAQPAGGDIWIVDSPGEPSEVR